MWLQSQDAARLCGVSSSYFQRFMRKALAVQPDVLHGMGCKRNRWGARHVLGAMLCPTLERLGVSADWSLIVARSIAGGFHSDEACEAAIEGGRCFVVIAGGSAAPELQTAADVSRFDAELGPGLAKLGISLKAIDVRELWLDIRRAAGAEVGAEDAGAYAGE